MMHKFSTASPKSLVLTVLRDPQAGATGSPLALRDENLCIIRAREIQGPQQPPSCTALSNPFLPGKSCLHFHDLVQPPLMSLSLGKTRRQEGTNQVIRQRWTDDPGTQAENIGIIILATLAS